MAIFEGTQNEIQSIKVSLTITVLKIHAICIYSLTLGMFFVYSTELKSSDMVAELMGVQILPPSL